MSQPDIFHHQVKLPVSAMNLHLIELLAEDIQWKPETTLTKGYWLLSKNLGEVLLPKRRFM